jgi:ABC-type glutathione transport system ATPase component
MLLEVEGLSKGFRRPGSRIREMPVDGASFAVDAGEIVGLTGISGAGKSTISRLLVGVLAADAGAASFDGHALISGGRYFRDAGSGIQLVPQQPYAALDPRQRIADAIAEPLVCAKPRRRRDEVRADVSRLFEAVSLNEELGSRLPSQISGGQAQRAVIARVLAASPRLLIADEATSMLDVSAQAEIIHIFRELSREKGIAILLISHDIGLVQAVACRAYGLSGGKTTEWTWD